MKDELKVSIAVPVYKVEQYIERCVASLMEQTYSNIEYVFLDDCTPDKSIEILKDVVSRYPQRLPFVKIVSHKENKGIAETRNDLVPLCTGDFVYFVDSDDYLEKDAIEALVEAQKQSGADMVVGQNVVNEDVVDRRFVNPILNTKEEMLHSMLSQVWHHELWNRLIRTSIFEHGIVIEKGINVCEDWQIVPLIVFYAEKVVTIDKVTYHYVENVDSATHKKKEWVTEKSNYLQELQALKSNLEFFDKTPYEQELGALILGRLSDDVDVSLSHNDKDFFKKLRAEIMDLARKYPNVISQKKMIFIRVGYYPVKLFLFLHGLKTKQS